MEKMNIFIEDFPQELQRQFKAQCALEGKSMKEKIADLMKDYLGKKQMEKIKSA